MEGTIEVAHPMHERRGILRRVVLHHPVDVRDVEPARRQVRAQQARAAGGGGVVAQRLLARALLHAPVQREQTQLGARHCGQVRQHGDEKVHARARQKVHNHLHTAHTGWRWSWICRLGFFALLASCVAVP